MPGGPGVELLSPGLLIGGDRLRGSGDRIVLGEASDDGFTFSPDGAECRGHLPAPLLDFEALLPQELHVCLGGLVLPERGLRVSPDLLVEV